MKRNFNILGGFGIAEKELSQKKTTVKDIILKYYQVGVEEFFVGYNPPYWHEKYAFSISPNGRFGENENISSFSTLKEAVDIIHSLKRKDGDNCKVLLTMNGWQYSDLAFPLMERMFKEAEELSIDGLIIGNFEWMQYLAEVGYRGRISISTILNTYSKEAVEFWLDFGKKHNLNVYRIVLPREVTLNEMKEIIPAFPDTHFEVFGQGDYCRYANGNCFAEHKYFSRDICTFVLKQGLDIKKRVQYNFKTIIKDELLSESKKQYLLNPNFDAIDYDEYEVSEKERLKYLFIGNPLLTNHPLLDIALERLSNFYEITQNKKELIIEEMEFWLKLIYQELVQNFIKYIYDTMLPDSSPHNQNVNKYLAFFKKILELKEYNIDNYGTGGESFISLPNFSNEQMKALINKIQLIESYKNIGKAYFMKQVKEKGSFGLETYYKFMLYNRTSAPFFAYFNSFPNIDVVKIPLRGRDVSIFKMGLDLIDDAVENPDKYFGIEHISHKYLHYQPIQKFDFHGNINKFKKENLS